MFWFGFFVKLVALMTHVRTCMFLLETWIYFLSFSFQTLIKEVSDFVALLFPLTCSLCLINSIVTAAITKAVPRSDTGSVLGLNMAVHSAIRYDVCRCGNIQYTEM